MKQICKCGKTFKNRERRMECPSCEIERYNKGLKTKRNKNMDEPIKDPEAPVETADADAEEKTEEKTEETTDEE